LKLNEKIERRRSSENSKRKKKFRRSLISDFQIETKFQRKLISK
jgi:hypothetical protein